MRVRNSPGNIVGWHFFALLMGALTYFVYPIVKLPTASIVPIVITSALAFATVAIFIFAVVITVLAFLSRGSRGESLHGAEYAEHLEAMINAAKSLYDFLCELSVNNRCTKELYDLPGMENIDVDENPFTVTQRLGAIVYCDLRDCYRRLGYDDSKLSGLAGLGYVMILVLLVNRGFDLTLLHMEQTAEEMLKIVSRLPSQTDMEIDIKGHDVDFRFAFLMGTVNKEHEWVQRYATLVYRWASLIAKADGKISPEESAALASIMRIRNSASAGEVKIEGAKKGNLKIGKDGSGKKTLQRINVRLPQDVLKESMDKLNALVGLAPVKNDVRMLASFIGIQNKRKKSGLKEAPVSYHCVFTGNPGTGKTTVARIVADIYKAMGVVEKGHLVETDRSGLIAEYVGQTAVKTNKIIDSALDGILFIDEAYTLIQGGDKDYGNEAIATLLKRMEDDRDRLVVILAGYTDEMKKFIDSNPGLQSRFNRYIHFPDYNAEELAEIFTLTAGKSQYKCDDDVKASLKDIMETAVASKDRNFGNGRFVRNLFEKAIQRQALRLSGESAVTTEMLSILTLHDLGFKYED